MSLFLQLFIAFTISGIIAYIELFHTCRKNYSILPKIMLWYLYIFAYGAVGLIIIGLHFIQIKIFNIENVWAIAVLSGIGIHFFFNSKLLNKQIEGGKLILYYRSLHEKFFSGLKSMILLKISDYKQDLSSQLIKTWQREKIIQECSEYILSHYIDEEKSTLISEFGKICDENKDDFPLAIYYVNLVEISYLRRKLSSSDS